MTTGRRRRFRLGAFLFASAAAAAAAGMAALGPGLRAQSSADARRDHVPWPLRDETVTFFGIRDGLTQGSVYAVHAQADGTVLIAHDDGVSQYTGHRWVLETTPELLGSQVRGFLEHDGWLWLARRNGVVRRRGATIERFDAVTGGLPDPTVYSLARTSVFGTPTVVAGTAMGAARYTGRGFIPIALPPEVSPEAIVVATSVGPDGSETLWAGSATRGLAAYRKGAWEVQTAASGFRLRKVEQLVTAPAGSGVEVYAVGDDGVWERVQGRWRRTPMPSMPAYRMAVVTRGDGAHELWVGSRTGALLRRAADGTWGPMTVTRSGEPTPVVAIVPVPSPTGEPDVYVGLRGDRLARVSLGPAAAVHLPGVNGPRLLRTLVWDTVTGPSPTLWGGTVGYGVLKASSGGITFADTSDGVPSINVSSILPWRDAEGPAVWLATGDGPALWRGGRWRPDTAGVGRGLAIHMASVEDDDGTRTVALSSVKGLFLRRGGRWVRDRDLPPGQCAAVVEHGRGAARIRWAVSSQTVYRRRGTGYWERMHPFGDSTAFATAVRRVAAPGGDSVVVVLSAQRGFAWRRDDDTTWRAISPGTPPGFALRYPWDVVSNGVHLYAAGPSGVYEFRWMGRDSLAFVTSYSADDGLPSSEVLGLAFGPGGRLWAATVRGVAVLPRPRDPVPMLTRLDARTRRNPAGRPVAMDELLPPDVGVLEVELGLRSFHREQETLYRVSLEGSGNPPTDWTTRTLYTFGALSPGTYTLRAWARDWRGRETALAPLAFRVAQPWWWSYAARALYLLAGLGGAVAISRWRVRRLQLRALDLERNERRIAASERKFRALFDRAQDAHLLFEGEQLVSANAAARALVGAADLPSMTALLAPLRRPAAPAELDGDVRLLTRADGAVVPVRETRTTIALDDRVLEHLVLRDESAVRAAQADARRLEEQLRETQKLESIGTLAGGVAHDFNNLLSVIRGNTELALALGGRENPVSGELREVLSATDRARDLVRQILTFSRRTRPKRERVDVARLAHSLRGMLRATIPSTVDLRLDGPERGVFVEGDATQLQQALLNLCANAEYAMRETNGGRLGVSVATRGDEAVLTVSDTGLGMPPEVRARVFEPFFTTKPVGDGTGLGLSVLHGIVSGHGGSVEVSSTPGAGATFRIRLPLASVQADGDGRRATPAPPTVPRGTGQRVVVVDDEPAVRSATARTLSMLGYAVDDFEDPRAALLAITEGRLVPDLLVTDQTMPGLTGDLLVEAVRRVRPGLPAVIITGFSHRLTSERITQLGVPVLLKPVDLAELGAAVADAVGLSSPERSPA